MTNRKPSASPDEKLIDIHITSETFHVSAIRWRVTKFYSTQPLSELLINPRAQHPLRPETEWFSTVREAMRAYLDAYWEMMSTDYLKDSKGMDRYLLSRSGSTWAPFVPTSKDNYDLKRISLYWCFKTSRWILSSYWEHRDKKIPLFCLNDVLACNKRAGLELIRRVLFFYANTTFNTLLKLESMYAETQRELPDTAAFFRLVDRKHVAEDIFRIEKEYPHGIDWNEFPDSAQLTEITFKIDRGGDFAVSGVEIDTTWSLKTEGGYEYKHNLHNDGKRSKYDELNENLLTEIDRIPVFRNLTTGKQPKNESLLEEIKNEIRWKRIPNRDNMNEHQDAKAETLYKVGESTEADKRIKERKMRDLVNEAIPAINPDISATTKYDWRPDGSLTYLTSPEYIHYSAEEIESLKKILSK